MRVHRVLGVPELSIPAPFAMGSSFQDEEFVVYTSGGSYQLRVGSGAMIVFSVFCLFLAVIASVQGSLWNPVPIQLRYITVLPAWALYPLGGFLLIAGVKYFLEAGRKSQIVICRHTGSAQIQYRNGTPKYSEKVRIHVTHAELIGGPMTGQRMKPINSSKRGEFYLVAFGVADDCFITGAFQKKETASDFAIFVAEKTGLDISDQVLPELRQVAGDRMYLFRSSDRAALKRIRKTKPMQPISFS